MARVLVTWQATVECMKHYDPAHYEGVGWEGGDDAEGFAYWLSDQGYLEGDSGDPAAQRVTDTEILGWEQGERPRRAS